MPKRKILLFIFTIAILHSPIISAQKVKERAMVVYSKKTKEHSKAKTFAAFADFGTSLFMRQDPMYPDLSECNASLDIDISYGYFINSYFYIGPGTGIRTYFGENFTMFPLFGELRGYWKRIFIYSRGGYSLSTSGNNDRGGAYASIGLGLNFISKTRYKLFFSMGYEFQDHRRKDTSVLRKEILTGKNGIAIRIGTQF
ncbi:hypothetical protein [uncultured Coprobacter sp.]|jgi:hypothetical protein|uniref:hypothetical protein n=1 Tax=uncultured Coprobacter sp. TaxID=1720550 RepID=UPI0025E237FF|nr:hypothetical protein [uncultured Coprobacter sp.]